jgi:hypothetical protein
MMKEVHRASIKKKKSYSTMSDEQKNSSIPFYCEAQEMIITKIKSNCSPKRRVNFSKLSSKKDQNEYFIGVSIYWLLAFFSFLVFMILPLLVQTYLVPFLTEKK